MNKQISTTITPSSGAHTAATIKTTFGNGYDITRTVPISEELCTHIRTRALLIIHTP